MPPSAVGYVVAIWLHVLDDQHVERSVAYELVEPKGGGLNPGGVKGAVGDASMIHLLYHLPILILRRYRSAEDPDTKWRVTLTAADARAIVAGNSAGDTSCTG
jgi:hypothetical protein